MVTLLRGIWTTSHTPAHELIIHEYMIICSIAMVTILNDHNDKTATDYYTGR